MIAMDDENSEKFLCPKCGEHELEDLGWGLKCRNCGYAMPRLASIEEEPWSVSQFIKCAPLLVIYLLPIIIYSFILLVICCYTLYDICSVLYFKHEEFEIGFLSTMVLYIILLLTLMDLTRIAFERFLKPVLDDIGGRPNPKSPKERRDDTRTYITTVIAMSIIFILMHTFYKMFECSNVTISFAVLILACLLGAAAVLIAVGLWKKLDSESD